MSLGLILLLLPASVAVRNEDSVAQRYACRPGMMVLSLAYKIREKQREVHKWNSTGVVKKHKTKAGKISVPPGL